MVDARRLRLFRSYASRFSRTSSLARTSNERAAVRRSSLRCSGSRTGGRRVALPLLLAGLIPAGCARELMRTPNLYADAPVNPWADVPEALAVPRVDVIYATDRLPVAKGKDVDPEAEDTAYPVERGGYGFGRSRSLAFGVCPVEVGEDLTWDELVAESRRSSRTRSIPLKVGRPQEIGRFPRTPLEVVSESDAMVIDPKDVASFAAARTELQALVAARLAQTPDKDLFIFVHGFNTRFDDAVAIMADLWHFLGREGVPIVYTWPSGAGMDVRGYNHDRESGEFTVLHLKHFLETLAAVPELERMHLIAHSRGTDVMATALRELQIKYRGEDATDLAAGSRALRLGHVILAAPDIDYDVARQRLQAERVGSGADSVTIYSSPDDMAIAIAKFLFVSAVRLGTLGLADLADEQRLSLAQVGNFALVDAQVVTDLVGHSYFYKNPAVASDLILLLRADIRPGAEHGRPLEDQSPIWVLRDAYPGDIKWGEHGPGAEAEAVAK